MIVVVDERDIVLDGYKSLLSREGFPTTGFCTSEFHEWIDTAGRKDLESVGACLVGEAELEKLSPKRIREKTRAPLIALVDQGSLEDTLKLFESGFDDVVRKPVHIREILARISVISRRSNDLDFAFDGGRLRIYFDGRDSEIDGEVFPLPRRERRILEYLASVGGRRVDKTQIFNAIYGVFDETVDDNVVESHISKLRKKLRARLGYDPIDSKRFLGYRLVLDGDETPGRAIAAKSVDKAS
ncbi:MAG: response regulator transcription factor [Notoacmeibacter sp.]|nr:response regulator transcription factor [Notoacmeibacter sp.]